MRPDEQSAHGSDQRRRARAVPTVYKNPNLTDYFVALDEVEVGRAVPSIVDLYEAGKVLTFPNFKLQADHDFWASLPVDAYPGLRKGGSRDDGGITLRKTMRKAGVPEGIADRLHQETERVLKQVLPIYRQLFAGYKFAQEQRIVWRLNSTMNENLHVDAYNDPKHEHFARLFINLDNQPRIWMTSFTLEELYARHGAKALELLGPDVPPHKVQTQLNKLAFGETSLVWWDNQPRHVIYFDPGDIWAVDSRLVSHQIFYGRRAASVDFFVVPESMRNRRRQYIAMAEDFISAQTAT